MTAPSTSQWGVVVDGAVVIATATGVAAVFDGPPMNNGAEYEFVAIGWDGVSIDDDPAAQIDQSWDGIGAKHKTETATIPGAVSVASGDTTLKTVRDRALVIFGLMETAFRADPTLGVLSPPAVAHLSAFTPYQNQNEDGAAVRLVFTISYQARI